VDVLREDANFLASQGLIDYSLVFGRYSAVTKEEQLEALMAYEESEARVWRAKDEDAGGESTVGGSSIRTVDEWPTPPPNSDSQRGCERQRRHTAPTPTRMTDLVGKDTDSEELNSNVHDNNDDILIMEKASMFSPLLNDVTRMNQLRVVNTARGAVFCGIIDILTPWRTIKKTEHFIFSKLCCGRDISCQPPKVYAERFVRWMRENAFLPPDVSTRLIPSSEIQT
jgi:1-phosphatidylinositol-4-phosphate 5-kinase